MPIVAIVTIYLPNYRGHSGRLIPAILHRYQIHRINIQHRTVKHPVDVRLSSVSSGPAGSHVSDRKFRAQTSTPQPGKIRQPVHESASPVRLTKANVNRHRKLVFALGIPRSAVSQCKPYRNHPCHVTLTAGGDIKEA